MSYIISIILLLAFGAGLYKMFEKAGEAGWKAIVPGLNLYTWIQLTGRPIYWLALLLVPIVGIFIFAYMLIDLVKCFGKFGFWEQALALVVPFIYYPFIGFRDEEKYLGRAVVMSKENPIKKSIFREWAEAIIFAVFAATFIRMFLIEAYTIPTPSMEGSLMVGDFLFVSKLSYGSRMPVTPIQFPLVHNKVPFIGNESYSEAVQWKYRRLPAIRELKRYDPVVFNFPEGDTVAFRKGVSRTAMQYTHYYGLKRQLGEQATKRNYDLVTRPLDKRDNYIKRCVGLPGDIIEIKNRVLYVNGEEAQKPEGLQFTYQVNATAGKPNQKLLDELDIDWDTERALNKGIMYLTEKQATALANDASLQIKPLVNDPNPSIFPHDGRGWSMDNFGPITIPKKGDVISIGPKNIGIYKRVIRDYEGNDLGIGKGGIEINGKPATEYTIQQDYYWMMGDNRHNSEDSRVWGFVPQDHIVGKPLFIWMSLKNGHLFTKKVKTPTGAIVREKGGINFKRLFRGANDMAE